MMSTRLIALVVSVASADYNIEQIMNQQDSNGPQVQPSAQAPVVQNSFTPMNNAAAGVTPLEASLQSSPSGSQYGSAAAPASTFQTSAAGSNPMQTLLNNAVTTPQQAGSPPGNFGGASPLGLGAKPLNGVLSQDSMAVVSGLVESFMHKAALEPGERSCLERNIGQLTGDIMGTVGDVVTAIEALVQGKGTIQRTQTGGVVSAGIDSAMKITSLVALSTQLVKNCVHGDALILLKETAHHLVNGTYLERRFLVNGVDIAHSLSDSIVAFESKDFHRFGADIGFALRKILLSNANNGTQMRLPEGLPEEKVIEQCTDGLMKGFFVEGSAVQITDTAHPDIDINIDLHQCIAGNSAFFKEIWLAAWHLISQLAVNAGQHQFNIQQFGQAFQGGGGKQPKWAGELMIAMMQVPMALEKCGVAQDMQNMFMEAIKTLNDIKVHIALPDDRFRAASDQTKAEETTARMAKAVEAFTNFQFENFGFEIGKMLRELVMLAFPQQYSTGANGMLQRKYSMMEKLRLGKKSELVPEATAIIGGAVVSMLIVKFAFVALRLRRSAPTETPFIASDVEGGEAPALE